MKTLISVLLPLLLSGCAVAHSSFTESTPLLTVTVVPASSHDPAGDNIVLPLNARAGEVTTLRSTRSVPYTRETVFTNDRKTQETHDRVESGTVITATVTQTDGGKKALTLDVQHTCPPQMKTFTPDSNPDARIDLPSLRSFSLQKTLVVQEGEKVRIRSEGLTADCAFPRIDVHPTA
ncbi:hypothetical protein [Citrobacter koseri]|uniref:hypothetical protein n=1 Tax=Citrobacter koseri TaxID=545 RepID=UPI000DF0E982|nr:hypothetical protein [Citrobacter koseri]EJF0242664.1 hypothetical protein [Salmonella enterica subsp. enterica serovar Liverpool]STB73766.1 Uncharacterised protein [Citrobacter koseri]